MFDPLPNETARAYNAFVIYRNLGPERSIDAAFLSIRPAGKRAPGYWNAWATLYQWVRRAAAYDVHIAGIAQAAFERRVEQLARDRAEYGFENFRLLKRRRAKLEDILDKYDVAGVLDGSTARKSEGGAVTVTKVKGINAAGLAKLAKEARDTGDAAIGAAPTAAKPRGDDQPADDAGEDMGERVMNQLAKLSDAARLQAEADANKQASLKLTAEAELALASA